MFEAINQLGLQSQTGGIDLSSEQTKKPFNNVYVCSIYSIIVIHFTWKS